MSGWLFRFPSVNGMEIATEDTKITSNTLNADIFVLPVTFVANLEIILL